jgi:predicted ester cyclase
MSTQTNKALVHRFLQEVVNSGNIDAVEAFVHPSFTNHNAPHGLSCGIDGVKQLIQIVRTAFPDLHVTCDSVMAEGDNVVTRLTIHGIHTGKLFSLVPYHGQAKFMSINILRIDNGRFVEHWGSIDALCMLRQLGVIPAPASVISYNP